MAHTHSENTWHSVKQHRERFRPLWERRHYIEVRDKKNTGIRENSRDSRILKRYFVFNVLQMIECDKTYDEIKK